jgi:hypothetical protein
MNNQYQIPKWKEPLKWLALALISVAVLDWLLDGRLRSRLPLRRKGGRDVNTESKTT